MKFNIISNINNGYGLQRDYEIIRARLAELGHEVLGFSYHIPEAVAQADINIFLETVIPVFHRARESWLIPNPEWFDEARDGRYIRKFNRILCKTQDAFRIFRSRSDAAEYLGFESRDIFDPQVIRHKKFLHIAGKSMVKGTGAVMRAWKRFKIPYPLTVISSVREHVREAENSQITLYKRIPDEGKYSDILNHHLFHIYPSQYEGWGHCIHEALGIGAIVLTTDAPPMNEVKLEPGRFIPKSTSGSLRMATMHQVRAEDIINHVGAVIALNDDEVKAESDRNRQLFLSERDAFRERFAKIVNDAAERLKCAA